MHPAMHEHFGIAALVEESLNAHGFRRSVDDSSVDQVGSIRTTFERIDLEVELLWPRYDGCARATIVRAGVHRELPNVVVEGREEVQLTQCRARCEAIVQAIA